MNRLLVLFAVALLARPTLTEAQRLHYPESRTADHVDDYHGRKIADP